MNLEKILQQEKDTVITRWFDLVTETYVPETAQRLKKETNRFANPVGQTTLDGLKDLTDAFLQGSSPEDMAKILDRIIRIRAIQEFTPSQAVAFVFGLKKIARELLAKQKEQEEGSVAELMAFDFRVDELALLAFNVYMRCRENLFEVRINEVKSRSYRLLQRANLLGELDPQPEPDVKEGNLQ
ncbi:MAG: RsbRD N-terminal domain-containing protein [Acidobacteriota bacterium]